MFFLISLLALAAVAQAAQQQPNVLFLLVDDWGTGDLDVCPDHMSAAQCPYRSFTKGRQQLMHNPNIRKMAREGQIMSNFYSPRAICTPSRAAFLTGRDPTRFGMMDGLVRVLAGAGVRGGLPPTETTVAKYLKDLNYTTGYTGKWHMGLGNGTDPVAHTPINLGFDEARFFLEGSNGEQCQAGAYNPPGDNNIYHACSFDHIQNCDAATHSCTVVEQPVRWENVTARHVSETLSMMQRAAAKDAPWFIQHSFTQLHQPWVPSRHFVTGYVGTKPWTSVVGEVDWAVGVLLDQLETLGVTNNTLVVLSGDNGAYLEFASSFCPQNCRWQSPEAQRKGTLSSGYGCTPCDGDSPSLSGPFIAGKGTTYEGGMRVPTVFRWPGTIPANTVNPIVSSGLDLLPTFVSVAGGELNPSINVDGRDISASLTSPPAFDSEPEGSFVYWCANSIMAVRLGRYKVVWKRQDFVGAPGEPTPAYFCAGTGHCCVDSPSRLCTCELATTYDPPLVLDLLENTQEDVDAALPSSPETDALIAEATAMRLSTLSSVMSDRRLPSNETFDEMSSILLLDFANQNNIDYCAPRQSTPKPLHCWNNSTQSLMSFNFSGGCSPYPDECNIPGFVPYQNCSTAGTYSDPTCQMRLPCCKDASYLGPYEYVHPRGDSWDNQPYEQCGCFNNGESSYFPDELTASLCDWQRLAKEESRERFNMTLQWCTPETDYCYGLLSDEEKESNAAYCRSIEQSLNNIPENGAVIFNSPYPDTQLLSKLRYPNQESPPPHDADAPSTGCHQRHRHTRRRAVLAPHRIP